MIISCQNCSKNFDVESSLIPEKGRLLECNSCNHRWFYKNENITKIIEPFKNENLEIFGNMDLKKNVSPIINAKEKPVKKIIKKISIKNEKKTKFLNLTIVLIISFIALIILLDTFESPLGKIVPNIEFLLHNLYDSIKDILLFVKDLI